MLTEPMAKRGIHGLCLIAWLGVSSPAVADDTIRLVYEDATGDCLDEEAIRSELAARVGDDRVDPESDREVTVGIERAHRELVARIVVSEGGEPTGRRELRHSGRRCDELTEDLLLTLTLIIDTPPARPPEPEPEAEPEPEPEPEPEDPVVPMAPEPEPATPEPLRSSIRVSLLGGASFGALPNVGWLVEADVEVALRSWVVAVGARYSGSPDESFAPGSIRATSVRARAFAGYAVRGLEAGLALAAGALVAAGRGFAENTRVSRASVGVGPRVSWTWRASPTFGLRIFGELLFSIVGTDIRVDTETAWASGPVAGSLGAGVVWGA